MFSDALRSENFIKTLNAFISKLHFKNGSETTDFVQIYRAYVKKCYLVSKESF